MTPSSVVPAKAGTQCLSLIRLKKQRRWIPAFAGTTTLKGSSNKNGKEAEASFPRGQALTIVRRRTFESAARWPPWLSRSGRSQYSSRQTGLRLVGQRAKRLDVVHGDVGEHLAVDRDAGLPEAVHQAAVAHAVLASGRVDAHDPERAEIALLLLAADVGV